MINFYQRSLSDLNRRCYAAVEANKLDWEEYGIHHYPGCKQILILCDSGGANENLNGLVRQYFPKGMEFTSIEQSQIDQVVNTLNNRSRKRFDFLSPNEV